MNMQYNLSHAREILSRTPSVLEAYLDGISDVWYNANEGPETWTPYDVIGHLIHGEKTDWIQRVKITLSEGPDKKFAPFDRLAQFQSSKGRTLHQLLQEFKELRKENLRVLDTLPITEKTLTNTAIHPAFGTVTLSQLLSTWVVHDLTHIAQITRVMAKQYKEAIGPWIEFISVVKQ